MWSKSLAKQFAKAKHKWFTDCTFVADVKIRTGKPRERFLAPSFMAWGATNVSTELLNAFRTQYEKSYNQTPMKSMVAFTKNLEDCKLCEVCHSYAMANATTRVCGVCRITPEGKEYAVRTAIRLGQAALAENKEAIDQKRIKTCMERYGAATPWQNPKANKKFLEKKRRTCMAIYGHPHPTMHPDVAKRQQASAFVLKQITLKNKTYFYQGYEDYALERLVRDFGPDNVLSQYEETFPPLELPSIYFRPDMFVTALEAYVEVKSTYTMTHGTMLTQNKKKAKQALLEGYDVIWLVVSSCKTRACKMPIDWFTWTRTKLVAHLRDFI